MNIEIRNPAAPAEIVATYEPVPRTALDYLVARARAAQIEWACVPQPERGQIIGAFLDALEKDAADIANSITMEMGKPLSEALGEVAKAIGEGRATVARAAPCAAGGTRASERIAEPGKLSPILASQGIREPSGPVRSAGRPWCRICAAHCGPEVYGRRCSSSRC